MYSDLFEQLGAEGRLGGANAAAAAASSGTEPPALVSCKAGRVPITWQPEPGRFACEPDPTRGEIRLAYIDNVLQWQWYNRREKKVDHSTVIPVDNEMAFERIELPGKAHVQDRVFVLTKAPGEYEMYWMQDASDEHDDEVVGSINQYLNDPASAAPDDDDDDAPGGGGGAAAASGAGSATGGAAANNDQEQVDALSNILQNLGMPHNSTNVSGNAGGAGIATTTTTGVGNTAGGGGGTLTLEDLQGAMASMQAQQQSNAIFGLNDVVTNDAIDSILANDAATQRLVALLPAAQRTPEQLRENLQSPQVRQTLRALTQALLPDDASNMDGFYSVLANFSLETGDAHAGLAAGNPIQAFLDAVLAQVEREQADNTDATMDAAAEDDDDDGKEGEEQGGE